MPQVFYKDGTPVPDDKIAQAVATGEASTKSDRIAVKDARGNVGTIDASELGHPGYTVLGDQEIEHARMQQERGTLGQQGITALEGAGRGLSAGLSDVALGGLLGKDYTRGARERKEVNPLTSTGFEIGGAIAPALFTGGASAEAQLAARAGGAARAAEGLGSVARAIPSNLIARAGSFAERGAARLVGEGAESALGRMAQRAATVGAQGAIEGGLYGAGMAASEATLNDAPITAEKLLSGFGHGALFGGGAGAALGGAGSLASSALGKIAGSRGVREGAEALANKSALEAAGYGAGDLKRLASRTGRTSDQAAAELGPELLNYKFESGPLAGKKLFTGAKRAEDFVDDLALARQEVDAKVGAMREGVAPDLGAYFKRVDSELLEPMRASPSALVQRQGKQIERELRPLLDRITTPGAEPLGLGELEQVARDIKTALPERGKQAGTLLDQEIDAAVARNLEAKGLDPSQYTAQKKTLDALTEIEGVAQKANEAKGTNPQDVATGLQMAIGAMLTGNVGGLALGAASAMARKLVKERGQSVLAVMADNVAKMDGRIAEAAQSLAGAPRKAAIVARSSPDVGRFDETADAVRSFAQNPEEGQRRLAKPVEHIAPVHPALAAQMQETLAGDYAYLSSKLPPVMTRADSSLTPQVEQSRIPAAQKAKFMATVQALENPAGVIEKVANGELPQAQIDALKVRRPEIYQQMRTEVIKAFSTSKKPASFLERTRVSLAFDFNGDASLDPQTLKQIQSTNRNAAREPDQPATPQSKPPAGTSTKNLDPNLATSMMLPSEKAAVGG